MSARIITVRLTQPQFETVALAVNSRQEELQDGAEVGMQNSARELAVLNRAWEALQTAWYA